MVNLASPLKVHILYSRMFRKVLFSFLIVKYCCAFQKFTSLVILAVAAMLIFALNGNLSFDFQLFSLKSFLPPTHIYEISIGLKSQILEMLKRIR